ncbi:MAG: hypothetical protein AB3N14_19960, partial [Flavobacteriaceae bacterium]
TYVNCYLGVQSFYFETTINLISGSKPYLYKLLKKNSILFLVSTIVTLCFCEVIIRMFYPQITEHDKMFTYDNELGWKFISNKKGIIIYPGEAYHYIRTNEEGFREGPFPNNTDSTKKIMVLGDSFVSNVSVRDEEVFTEVLETLLPDYAVLNFGVNAYGQVQEYILQQKWVPLLKPDILVVMIYLKNDFTDNTGEKDWLYSRPYASLTENGVLRLNPAKDHSIRPSPKKGLLNKSHLYQFVITRTRNIRAKYSESNDQGRLKRFRAPELSFCRREPTAEVKEKFVIMKKLLMKISNHAKDNNVPIVFALAPSIVQVENDLWKQWVLDKTEEDEKYDRAIPNKILMDFAAEKGLNMLDLLPVLHSETKKGKKLYNPIEQHWTAEGNRVVAHKIMEYLKSQNFVSYSGDK